VSHENVCYHNLIGIIGVLVGVLRIIIFFSSSSLLRCRWPDGSAYEVLLDAVHVSDRKLCRGRQRLVDLDFGTVQIPLGYGGTEIFSKIIMFYRCSIERKLKFFIFNFE